METVDIILIILLSLGAIKGYIKGFIVEVFSLVAFVLGLFIAVEFTTPIALRFFGDYQWFHIISIALFLAIFVIITIIINFIAKALKKAIDLTFFGTFDNVFGALLGVLKWALILSVVLWLFRAVGLTIPKEYVDSSFLFPIVTAVGPTTFEWVSQILPFFRDIFDSMDRFERKGSIA
jgi:membrane protein required for colicin V production